MVADENRLYWLLDDPAEAAGCEDQQLEVFRRVRDEIRDKLSVWLKNSEETS